ncbi:hypothetical protein BGZ72_005115 [Mortierella alpina]|nr:hypothetical protein BGZ72_005115 [Mortierella alpina]
MEVNRRPRIVKRAPLWRRIISAPEDYLTKLENDIRALDWDMLQEGFSWPLALGLNLMLVSVKLGYWLDDPMANVPAVLKYDRSYSSPKALLPGFATLLASMQYILVAISIINAMWLFRSKTNYKIMHRELNDRPPSSSVQMVDFQQDVSHWSYRFPGKLIYPYISPFIRGAKPQENRRQIWELSVWNPSILCRNLFCWYSPAQVLIMAGLNSENFHIFLPLSVMVAMQVYVLVSVYQSYVKDKQIIFGEVCREYNTKFVYPKVFVRKYDKQVSTGVDTGTDTGSDTIESDRRLQHQEDSFGSSIERKPRTFRHLNVPASSSGTTSGFSAHMSTSPSFSSADDDDNDDDENEDKDEDEDEDEESEDSEDGDADTSNNASEADSDSDVEYDEDGEVPAIPHPTNSLVFDDEE